MRLPSTPVLVLILVILLAGCSGIVRPALQDTSNFAPGVSTERVTDASTLAQANRAILQNTSYTYTSNYSQRVSTEEYDYAVNHDTRVWVATDGSYLYYHHGVVNGTETATEYIDGVWANKSVAVMRTINVTNNSITYTRYRPPEPYPADNITRSKITDAIDGATITETWNESGMSYVRVHASDPESRRWQGADGSRMNLTTTENITATIREDGFVPVLNSSISGERPLPAAADDSESTDSRPIAQIHDQTRIRYSKLAMTEIPRPEWVDTALTSTDWLSYGETTSPRSLKTSP